MFCMHCGHALEDGDAFCENCGTKVEAPKYINCVHCGQMLEETDTFCGFCGKILVGAGGVRQPQMASAPPPPKTDPVYYQVPPPANPAQTYAPPPVSLPRMPLLFLLEVSVFTAPFIALLTSALNRFIADISSDSTANNALDLEFIQFGDSYNVVADLASIGQPQAGMGSSVNYSAPIREALRLVDEYSRSHSSVLKPWIVMITGSAPSDDISGVARELQLVQNSDKLRFMALGVQNYSSAALKSLTDVVFTQKGTDFTDFFVWLSSCVKVIARTMPGEKPQLPNLDGAVYRDVTMAQENSL